MSEEKETEADETAGKSEAAPSPEGEILKRLSELEDKNRFLSAQLTRNQQENAQWEKLFKAKMPEFMEPAPKRTFEETWEESPKSAVEQTADQKVAPVKSRVSDLDESLKRTQSEMYLTQILLENPKWKKYENKVRNDLGWKFAYKTDNKDGIRDLFQFAEATDPDRQKEQEKIDSDLKVEKEKSRAYTEGSSPREIPSVKARLTPEEKRIAQKLGQSEADYVAFRDRDIRERPVGWKSPNQRAREEARRVRS